MLLFLINLGSYWKLLWGSHMLSLYWNHFGISQPPPPALPWYPYSTPKFLHITQDWIATRLPLMVHFCTSHLDVVLLFPVNIGFYWKLLWDNHMIAFSGTLWYQPFECYVVILPLLPWYPRGNPKPNPTYQTWLGSYWKLLRCRLLLAINSTFLCQPFGCCAAFSC
jgi:hypothetical protein